MSTAYWPEPTRLRCPDYSAIYDPNSQYAESILTYLSGTLVYSTSINCFKLPLVNASYIYDTTHKRRTRDDQYGVGLYPPGNMFRLFADFTHLGQVRNFSVGGYDVVFDSTAHGTPQIPLGNLNAIIGPGDRILWRDYAMRVSKSVVDSLSEEAWNYFADVLPTHLSFSEFVQGFTQLADLLPSLGESITKTVSAGYLQKKFGWDNLLSDLDTLGGLVQTVLDRMDYFRRTYGIPQRLGFVRRIPVTESGNIGTYSLGSGYETVLTYSNLSVKYRATAWIVQTLDYMRDLAGFLRVFVGALGLNNPVKAFWNTVPLSFVVDWFFNTSQHLDNLTRLNPVVGWDVNDVTESLTYEYDVNVAFNYNGGSGFVSIATGVIHMKAYDRSVGLSFDWELLNPDELSTTQLTLLLSMLHQYA